MDKINGTEGYDRIRELLRLIREMEVLYKGEIIKITMTFGIVEFDPYKGLEDTIKQADELLYEGKKTGRNKVMY